MCAQKEEAATKVERLIAAIDRLQQTLERAAAPRNEQSSSVTAIVMEGILLDLDDRVGRMEALSSDLSRPAA